MVYVTEPQNPEEERPSRGRPQRAFSRSVRVGGLRGSFRWGVGGPRRAREDGRLGGGGRCARLPSVSAGVGSSLACLG
jgi:hypothetical protein